MESSTKTYFSKIFAESGVWQKLRFKKDCGWLWVNIMLKEGTGGGGKIKINISTGKTQLLKL